MNKNVRNLCIFFWLIALSSAVIFITEFSFTSNPSEAILNGYSNLKIVQLSSLFFITVFFTFFAYTFQTRGTFRTFVLQQILNRKLLYSSLLYFSLSVFLYCLYSITLFNPPIVISKLQLVIYWSGFISLSVSLLLIIKTPIHRSIQKKYLLNVVLVFSILLVLWILFLVVYRNFQIFDQGQPTVAITFHQGLFTFWIILTAEYLQSLQFFRTPVRKLFSLLFVITLFIVAGSTWNNITFRGSYNMVGPFPPGTEFFPHSDSIRIDSAAQSIFIGEGINFHQYVDNPLEVVFIALLHFLRGGSFSSIINLQVWLFALIPVMIFYMANKRFGLSGGIGSAVLYTFRVNNILLNTYNIGMSSPKIILSEGLLEPLLILLVLSVMVWFDHRRRDFYSLMVAGGLFSLSALVRANVWFILPFLLILLFFFSKSSKWQWLKNCIVLSATVFIVLLPWMYRSFNTINTPFFMLYKFQDSVLNLKYKMNFEDTTNNPLVNKIDPLNGINQYDPYVSSIIPDLNTSKEFTTSTISVKTWSRPSTLNNSKVDSIFQSNVISESIVNLSTNLDRGINIAIRIFKNTIFGFANSLLTLPILSFPISTISGLIFPHQFVNDYLSQPFMARWLIALSLLIVFSIFSIGTVNLFKDKRNGILLFGIYFAYIIASAAAFTSGSRYSQPVEWIFIIVFSIGCAVIARFIFPRSQDSVIDNPKKQHADHVNNLQRWNIFSASPLGSIMTAVIILCVSSGILIIDQSGSPHFAEKYPEEIINEFAQNSNKVDTDPTIFHSGDFSAGEGRIIYSLPLSAGKEYSHPFFVEKPYLKPDGYDMLALFVISPSGGEWVKINLQKQDWPKQSLVWKDAIYLGCQNEKTVQLTNLIVHMNENTDFSYQTSTPVSCSQ